MAARDYDIAVSPLTGTVYITKISKRNPDEMTDDRKIVEKKDFIAAFLAWLDVELKGKNELTITANAEPILRIEKLK